MIVFQQGELSVRKLAPEDAHLLVKWLSDPRVLEYYEGRDRPHDPALVQENFYNDNEGVTPCIIEYQSVPIGYLQFYSIEEEERNVYGYGENEANMMGMDQFIGEVEYWNKGIGSLLVGATVQYLIEHQEAEKIIMDPQTWNTRALKVYEKNGFTKKKLLEKHEYHEGEWRDCWLIEFQAVGK
ncbi:GNAT family N-acetyltransferase [Paenibacillus lutrae]|uniref:GNAT family N-acetyltransferase n=1 Tax=Paenibacillus lutrae TaxID=2078573 RepID=A0A7X3FGV8_9BACL|nr:GNAT family N-acetyltransferase [Paenibacillus lutrae]MVO99533.1 GNAT family N-acetyltransferase [Paenibacillus lutrae]